MLFTILSSLGLTGLGLALWLVPGLRDFLRGLPWQVWAAIAALALIAGGLWWHGRAVAAAHDAAFAAGRAHEAARWQGAFATMQQASNQWKTNYETAAAALSTERRLRHAEDLGRIAAAADDLRLRGPGKAAAPACRPIADPGAGTAAGGPVIGAAEPDAPRPGMPAPDGPDQFALVPWGWLVQRAEEHDRLLSEALAWRAHDAEQRALLLDRRAELKRQIEEAKPAFGPDG